MSVFDTDPQSGMSSAVSAVTVTVTVCPERFWHGFDVFGMTSMSGAAFSGTPESALVTRVEMSPWVVWGSEASRAPSRVAAWSPCVVVRDRELHDAEHENDQQWQDERELDGCGAALGVVKSSVHRRDDDGTDGPGGPSVVRRSTEARPRWS